MGFHNNDNGIFHIWGTYMFDDVESSPAIFVPIAPTFMSLAVYCWQYFLQYKRHKAREISQGTRVADLTRH